MSRVSHQTVRLEAGDHPHPGAGMCVLELASVLAGDRFSAYPRSVCPVIATFLRTYNDLVDDRLRQDLIPWAAAVVGSRGAGRVASRRARVCRRWVVEVAQPGFRHRPFWTRFALRGSHRHEAAAIYAALVARDGDWPGQRHGRALELLDRLLAAGPHEPAIDLPRAAAARVGEMA
jgi:hypothetical protein